MRQATDLAGRFQKQGEHRKQERKPRPGGSAHEMLPQISSQDSSLETYNTDGDRVVKGLIWPGQEKASKLLFCGESF